jgi:chromosome segregation protein
MKLTRLRLIGFKSFVEPTDFLIEPGLTGVVGPNGCGKSNLVEALRWVMGKASHKAMRAARMDDVIFSGNNGRAPRNTAEVAMTIDRPNRRSPRLLSVSSMLPPLRRQRRLQRHGYIGAIAGLQHLLPTLQEWCCHHPCKAHFRLAGSPLPGGS